MNFNLEEFKKDLCEEVNRVINKKLTANRKGKKSKAKINTLKLANKYNLSNDGYRFLDMVAGYSMFGTLSDNIENVVSNTVNTYLYLLEEELNLCIVK